MYPTEKSLVLEKTIHQAWQSLFKRFSDLLGEEQSKALTSKMFAAYQKLSA